MTKLKYSFNLKRIATLKTPDNQSIFIGEVEEYKEDGTNVSVTIKLSNDIKKHHYDKLASNPGLIQIRAISDNASKGILIEESNGVLNDN
ncbi:hypothetical protein EKK58_10000 [Candidatus Dependentiae bacterium]|nr:MAG: hypothetical protein EKK58_10000 [Candidatus Dependentiae bacterium]